MPDFVVHNSELSMDVVYSSWAAWQKDRRDSSARKAEPLPLVSQSTDFCAMCWGAGFTLVPETAANGEGTILTRRDCGYCTGGRVTKS